MADWEKILATSKQLNLHQLRAGPTGQPNELHPHPLYDNDDVDDGWFAADLIVSVACEQVPAP